jgi:hypothetical protein
MANPREDEEILLNMIRGSAEEVCYDDSQYLVDPNDQDNVNQVCNICSLLCLYT